MKPLKRKSRKAFVTTVAAQTRIGSINRTTMEDATRPNRNCAAGCSLYLAISIKVKRAKSCDIFQVPVPMLSIGVERYCNYGSTNLS